MVLKLEPRRATFFNTISAFNKLIQIKSFADILEVISWWEFDLL